MKVRREDFIEWHKRNYPDMDGNIELVRGKFLDPVTELMFEAWIGSCERYTGLTAEQ